MEWKKLIKSLLLGMLVGTTIALIIAYYFLKFMWINLEL